MFEIAKNRGCFKGMEKPELYPLKRRKLPFRRPKFQNFPGEHVPGTPPPPQDVPRVNLSKSWIRHGVYLVIGRQYPSNHSCSICGNGHFAS